jgi:DNA-binding NarL/FixJ family response regulator
MLWMPIKQVYRLREKVSYHAVNVFGLKVNPNAVQNWLQTSPKEHNLGLTPSQLQQFLATCTPEELSIFEAMKDGESVEAIAKKLGKKTNQVMAIWTKIYLAAQQLRTE